MLPALINCTLRLSPTLELWLKGTPFRLIIGLTCALSVLGALFIVLSYGCLPSLRSNARWILLHLSLMDFGVGLVNLLGNMVYFDRFYFSVASSGCYDYHLPARRAVQNLCITQAFFAMYFTYASVLWTISLAVYLYFLIVRNKTPLALASLRCVGAWKVWWRWDLRLWLLAPDNISHSLRPCMLVLHLRLHQTIALNHSLQTLHASLTPPSPPDNISQSLTPDPAC